MLIGVTIAIILNLFYDYKRQRNELIENMRRTEEELQMILGTMADIRALEQKQRYWN